VDEQGESFGPFNSSVDFFKFKVAGIRNQYKEWLQTRRVLSDDDRERAHSVISLYEKVASHLSDHDYGSFPLAHGDLGNYGGGDLALLGSGTTHHGFVWDLHLKMLKIGK
jgi:hypothetical protein